MELPQTPSSPSASLLLSCHSPYLFFTQQGHKKEKKNTAHTGSEADLSHAIPPAYLKQTLLFIARLPLFVEVVTVVCLWGRLVWKPREKPTNLCTHFTLPPAAAAA